MTTPSSRHLSPEGFADLVRTGVPLVHPIDGTPRILLVVDPDAPYVGIRVPAASRVTLAPTGLEHVHLRAVHGREGRAHEVVVSDRNLFDDAYPLLCAIADRVQLEHMTLPAAVADAIRGLDDLLARIAAPSREFEIGLVGEITFLVGLADAVGPQRALQAWRGGDNEEHDFGLDDTDAEIKTTTLETRKHFIATLTQLVPTGRRPLWVVSYQITRAGAGGRTLPDMIDAARQTFGACTPADLFTTKLRVSGWRDRYAEFYTQPWRLRTRPACFEVRDDFPRLTPAMLIHSRVDESAVADVQYRIDLTGRPSDNGHHAAIDTALAHDSWGFP